MALGWSFLFYGTLVLFQFAVLRAVGSNISLGNAAVVAPLVPLVSLLPVTANGLGLAEGAPVFHTLIVHYENGVALQCEDRYVNPACAPDYLQQDFTQVTPTHYLLLSLLEKSNLTPAEIDTVKGNLVFATKTPQAGELFRQGEVDAVAIWEPHLSESIADGKGVPVNATNTAPPPKDAPGSSPTGDSGQIALLQAR